ncbi:MAG TPA: hypothetical protein PLQ65_07830, partial [Flavihumibacter sp.]|nr:hypothetical protein [Flavihumibacter sp.]
AFIHNNILALIDGTVMGVLLGNCVFGNDGGVKAKFFQHTLFDLQGRILARENPRVRPVSVDNERLIDQAWKMIPLIKNHNCPIIDPTNDWSTMPLEDHFLSAPKMAAAV